MHFIVCTCIKSNQRSYKGHSKLKQQVLLFQTFGWVCVLFSPVSCAHYKNGCNLVKYCHCTTSVTKSNTHPPTKTRPFIPHSLTCAVSEGGDYQNCLYTREGLKRSKTTADFHFYGVISTYPTVTSAFCSLVPCFQHSNGIQSEWCPPF